MDHNDDDFDQLLKPIRDRAPHDLQIQKWQLAVQDEVLRGRKTLTTTRQKWAFQMMAAVFVGFIMGAAVIKSFFLAQVRDQNIVAVDISAANATFENSHTNLD